MVHPEGLEPSTSGFVIWRSNPIEPRVHLFEMERDGRFELLGVLPTVLSQRFRKPKWEHLAFIKLEQHLGFEPRSSGWKPDILLLN